MVSQNDSGLNQGLATEVSGGSFEHGFMAGSFTSLSTPLTNSAIGTPETRTLVSSIVGVTASSLGGGKFANGALSGAFIQMYNEDATWLPFKSETEVVLCAGPLTLSEGSISVQGGPYNASAGLELDDNGKYQGWNVGAGVGTPSIFSPSASAGLGYSSTSGPSLNFGFCTSTYGIGSSTTIQYNDSWLYHMERNIMNLYGTGNFQR